MWTALVLVFVLSAVAATTPPTCGCHGSSRGPYARLPERIARFDPLAIDGWLPARLRGTERDLMQAVENRRGRASTLIASQLSAESRDTATHPTGRPTGNRLSSSWFLDLDPRITIV